MIDDTDEFDDDIDDTNEFDDDIDDNIDSSRQEKQVENSDSSALAPHVTLHVTLHVVFE